MKNKSTGRRKARIPQMTVPEFCEHIAQQCGSKPPIFWRPSSKPKPCVRVPGDRGYKREEEE